jgi:hypothetical protein
VFGAQAVSVHGRPRVSLDVDITVQMEPHESAALVGCLEAAGFELRVPDEAGFVERTRVIPLRHRPSALGLDVVLAGPGWEEQFLDRARPTEIGGVTVPIISAEDLVVTKILAGRPKDFDDVVGVLREKSSDLDLPYVRRVLGSLEQVLSVGDLLPELDRALVAARPRPRRR